MKGQNEAGNEFAQQNLTGVRWRFVAAGGDPDIYQLAAPVSSLTLFFEG